DTLLHYSKFVSARFDDAALAETNLNNSDCSGASFRNADLTKANMESTNLCGADLTGAKVKDAVWVKAKFDEKTRFPKGFTAPESMKWVGKGPPPGLPGPTKPGASIDFDTFLARVKRYTDADRLTKALKMLKADRFQLFADVQPISVVGVVKSQTDKDL